MKEFIKRKKTPIAYVTLVVLAIALLIIGNRITTQGKQVFGKFSGAPVVRAKIDIMLRSQTIELNVGSEKHIFFEAEVISGSRKGDRIFARQITDTMYTTPIKEVEYGDRVMLSYSPYGEENYIWVFQEYDRSIPIFALLTLFFVLLLLFGGKKGFATILSLALTCSSIFYFFVPTILSGYSIYSTTFITCIYVIVVTLILVNGFNYKSASAAAGCLGGLMVSGILFFIMDHFLRLTGMIDEDTAYLTMLDVPIDLKAVIFASVLIGVLGGVLDVAVSIAASLSEIYTPDRDFTVKDVFKSGMNIGKDIICTMTNTLILVYIGSALPLTLLLTVYSNTFFELLNREMITVEILQALLGSIGLVFTIPITTIFYALGAVGGFSGKKKVSVEVQVPKELAEPVPFKMNAIPKGLNGTENQE